MALAIQDVKALIDKLDKENALNLDEWEEVIRGRCEQVAEYAAEIARQRSKEIFGNKIYTRGLIEISNYCKNNCYYCGIRRDNRQVERYRLSREDILSCADIGADLGFRTFVLQGGEDAYYTDQVMCDLIREIKKRHPDCAITLSLGERSRESYRLMKEAGADRYLLRHETADKDHYESLHPQEMDFDHRIQCLYTLKELGYQVGCGFMVGSLGADSPYTGSGYGLYPEFTACHGGDRTFCASSRDTPERSGTGDSGGDFVFDLTASYLTAQVAASGNDSAGDDRPARTRKGNFGRSQCRYAKSVTDQRAQTV